MNDFYKQVVNVVCFSCVIILTGVGLLVLLVEIALL